MRVQLLLDSSEERLFIPMDFRRYFISLTKMLLYKSPYFQRFEQTKPGYSPYVFGIKFAKFIGVDREKNKLVVVPPIIFTFSTGLFGLMADICNNAIANKGEITVLGLQLLNIRVLPIKKITSETVCFHIVGHASLRGKDGYLDPANKTDLEESINTHLETKFRFLRQNYEIHSISLQPIRVTDYKSLKKGVCEHYGGKITTLKGNITLIGKPEVLQFLYDYGLGVRSGQGFGLLEVISQL